MGRKSFYDDYKNGLSTDCYTHFGNREEDGIVSFSVWAPGALAVRVIGDFNSWGAKQAEGDVLRKDRHGIWKGSVAGILPGSLYKYLIRRCDGSFIMKNDPYAVCSENRPGTASVVMNNPSYKWGDARWMNARASADYQHSPVNIYELHMGSWKRGNIPGIDYENNWEEAERRKAEEPYLNYRETAALLSEYVKETGYTHVEIMPLCQHPLDGSWGYQTGSYYAVDSRYGTPEDLKFFVDTLHKAGIGVILDWVPGHFCKDDSWLSKFDGTYLYEYGEENFRENPLWGTANFNLGKGEVRSFLISNAVYWMKEYHVDGLRVDAVANILYLDYNRMHKKRPQNAYGGNENIDGVDFLRSLNAAVHREIKNPLMIAEDSSTWPMVTMPRYLGGLGFDFKWNMGWMNDTLSYMETPSVYRSSVHNKMTFSICYAFSENYILPISHDEVCHGKKTLLDKMAGETLEEKFAALRAYLVYMMGHPGKKMLFMGSEFGQLMEWRYYEELEWKMLLYPLHGKLKEYVKTLNGLYRKEKPFYLYDDRMEGFSWIDANNAGQNVFSFIRYGETEDDFLVFLVNMSPVSFDEYKIGVPRFADYKEILNSDCEKYGGTGTVNGGLIRPGTFGWNGQPFHVSIKLPGYGAMIFKPVFRRKKSVK